MPQFRRIESDLGLTGALLGPSCGPETAIMGPSEGVLGVPRAPKRALEVIIASIAARRSWNMGSLGPLLEPFWDSLGAFLGPSGAILGASSGPE